MASGESTASSVFNSFNCFIRNITDNMCSFCLSLPLFVSLDRSLHPSLPLMVTCSGQRHSLDLTEDDSDAGDLLFKRKSLPHDCNFITLFDLSIQWCPFHANYLSPTRIPFIRQENICSVCTFNILCKWFAAILNICFTWVRKQIELKLQRWVIFS